MHYNDTLPDLSNVLQKQSWQVLSRLDIETIGPVSLSLLRWQFILGEWIDKHIRKVILETLFKPYRTIGLEETKS